ncbi:MAG: trypsin-like peptidase domain-containing protein [Eubacteriales bacterium]|nr:trypsin-like peptidase domain-containing protein [Eubacteriales bacterium]
MYNNDDNNFNKARFDTQTGEPLYDTQQAAQAPASEQPDGTYRYSRDNIPFSAEGGTQNTDMNGQCENNNSTNYNGGYYNSSYSYNGNSYAAGEQNVKHKEKKAKVKKEKKPAGFAKRAVRFVASALLFGAIAGGAMYGAYYAGFRIAPVENKTYEIATVSSAVTQMSNSKTDLQADMALSNLSMNVEAVAQAAMPAMVALTGTTTVSPSGNSFYGAFGGAQSYEATTSGTGIIVGKNETELLILTNAHVVEGVNNLGCIFVDNETVSATVKGSMSDQDIAVVAVKLSDIKSTTIDAVAIAELADSNDVVLGQEVVAIGNALGEGQSVTNGIISALNRSITVDNVTFSGLIMTNAAINSGNSGGALLNAEGKVIAINFAKTSSDGVEGMAYSIPVSNVSDLIGSLMTRETRTKVSGSEASFLGISGLDVTAAVSSQLGYPQGVIINSVQSDSAAAGAGLAKYDIIVGFDDQTVSSMTGLQTTMQYYKAGETVTIDYYHLDGSEYVLKSVDVTLGKKN